jgi:hypothetical protein
MDSLKAIEGKVKTLELIMKRNNFQQHALQCIVDIDSFGTN